MSLELSSITDILLQQIKDVCNKIPITMYNGDLNTVTEILLYDILVCMNNGGGQGSGTCTSIPIILTVAEAQQLLINNLVAENQIYQTIDTTNNFDINNSFTLVLFQTYGQNDGNGNIVFALEGTGFIRDINKNPSPKQFQVHFDIPSDTIKKYYCEELQLEIEKLGTANVFDIDVLSSGNSKIKVNNIEHLSINSSLLILNLNNFHQKER